MNDAIRARLADAVDLLSDLDTMLDRADADRLPPLLQARVLVQLARLTARLARLRQALAGALADTSLARARRGPPGADGGPGAATKA